MPISELSAHLPKLDWKDEIFFKVICVVLVAKGTMFCCDDTPTICASQDFLNDRLLFASPVTKSP